MYQPPRRRFLPDDLRSDRLEDYKTYYNQLLNDTPETPDALEDWMRNYSEWATVFSDVLSNAFIRKTTDTTNADYQKAYERLVTQEAPEFERAVEKLNRKLINSPYVNDLPPVYDRYLMIVRNELELFNEENVQLKAKEQAKANEFSKVIGGRMFEFDGEEVTQPRLGMKLREYDRDLRERAWRTLQERKYQDLDTLQSVYSDLVGIRHNIAVNAGFENYRDYSFKRLKRFDYTPEDCKAFHRAVAEAIRPVCDEFDRVRRDKLGYDDLRPWDLSVDIHGDEPLKPFRTADELVDGCIRIFNNVKSGLGDKLALMREYGHLDLESRKGKELGGYNCPLHEYNIPFIFMNAVGTQRDLTTLLHEGGHALHGFRSADQPLLAYKEYGSEVAELASMSMELITMDYWDAFYDDPQELRRAKIEQIEDTLSLFPQAMLVDAFQHWVYENPEHTEAERLAEWKRLFEQFNGSAYVNRDGLDKFLETGWQFTHIFEVPFYYIEYAIAQLGALQVWRNYKQNPEKAVEDYLAALSLGGSVGIPEMYERAGIRFDFSAEMIGELMQFVRTELEALR